MNRTSSGWLAVAGAAEAAGTARGTTASGTAAASAAAAVVTAAVSRVVLRVARVGLVDGMVTPGRQRWTADVDADAGSAGGPGCGQSRPVEADRSGCP
ncbi:hypothetical protein GCM10028789_16020 [Sinomonas halotolerans]